MGPDGELRPLGRLTDASNATFLCQDESGQGWVYKPVAGERRLWDFPEATLARREVAAHELGERFGFGVVPLTVWLEEAPFGPGSAQRWVDHEISPLVDLLSPEEVDHTWLPVVAATDAEDRPVVLAHRDDAALRNVCLFDLVINNTDRKASHLLGEGQDLVGIDHGASLHEQDKFRTVLWGWMGDPFTREEQARLADVAALPGQVPPGLSQAEWEAVGERATRLLALGCFPEPSGDWPAIPWPVW